MMKSYNIIGTQRRLAGILPALPISNKIHHCETIVRPRTVSTRLVKPIINHSLRHRSRCVRVSASSSAPENGNGRNIVIAVDTSQASQATCKWVLEHLIRPGDVIHLAHCIPAFPTQGLYTLPDGRIAVVNFEKLLHNESEYLSAAERVVSEWAWSIFHTANVPYVIDLIKEEEAIAGSKPGIARQLCAKAAELNAAALVLTPHGRGGLGELVMGSVAADCTRNCEKPVVVLHELPEAPGNAQSGSVGWLADILNKLGHSDSAGTAVESIAQAAATGPLHPGSNAQSKKKGLVSTGDFSADDENILGQTVGELPRTEAELPGVDPDAPIKHHKHGQGRVIVVAVDDSDASEHACEWAAKHMWRKGDILHLLHVIPSLPSVAWGSGPMSGLAGSFLYVLEPPTAAFKEATERYMERRFHGMLREAEVDFESDILLEMTDGGAENVGQALLTRADDLDAAAVVVGSHGRGVVGELLLGSVGNWLSHHSERPVVILH